MNRILIGIINVSESGYIPKKIHVKTKITQTSFVAYIKENELEEIKKDNKIINIENLRPQEFGV